MKGSVGVRGACGLLLLFVTACGGSDEAGKGPKRVLLPELVLSSTELVFEGGVIGEPIVLGVEVRNAGPGVLTLDDATVVNSSGGTAFAPGAEWHGRAVVEPDASLRFEVSYTRAAASAHEGYLEFATNDPRMPDGYARVMLSAPALAGGLEASPSEVMFREENSLMPVWEVITISNTGAVPVEIDEVYVQPSDGPFRVTFPTAAATDAATDEVDAPSTVDAGGSFRVRVHFAPTDLEPVNATLFVEPRDPAMERLSIPISGNAPVPCIVVSPEGPVELTRGVGSSSSQEVRISNCSGRAPLDVRAITVCSMVGAGCEESGPFRLASEGALEVAPRATATVEVEFTPEAPGEYEGLLSIESDDPERSEVEVAFHGIGVEAVGACPQAVAKAQLAGSSGWTTDITTIPLQVVEFSAEDTMDADGTIARYEWTIVQRPNGSTAAMTPSSAVATPTLFIDLAGDYVVELRVYDDAGNPSCGDEALITIQAIPDQDVHVQLVWDTPQDEDQTDAFGTDLDLHFLHPSGTWNNAPYDIHWLNPTADWGNPGPSDDPSLDIDDTNGAGPENVNMQDPTPGLSYSVGVYYYADEGHGPSYATIRVYIRGTQAYEYRDMFLPTTGTFWYAATITWASGAVAGINTVQQGFPNRN